MTRAVAVWDLGELNPVDHLGRELNPVERSRELEPSGTAVELAPAVDLGVLNASSAGLGELNPVRTLGN